MLVEGLFIFTLISQQALPQLITERLQSKILYTLTIQCIAMLSHSVLSNLPISYILPIIFKTVLISKICDYCHPIHVNCLWNFLSYFQFSKHHSWYHALFKASIIPRDYQRTQQKALVSIIFNVCEDWKKHINTSG